MIQRLLGAFIIFVCGLGLTLVYATLYWPSLEKPLATPIVIELARGEPLQKLAERLHTAGLVDSATLFIVYTRLEGGYGKFQAGPYRFADSITPEKIVATMTRGEIYQPVVMQFNIPEGASFGLIARKFVDLGLVRSPAELRRAWHSKALLQEFNIPSTSIEGYLYPATYNFTKVVDLHEALRVGVKKFWDRLPPQYAEQVKTLGLTLAQAVTFASLIEVETRVAEERPKVAEVIWARLKRGEPLAIDAALIYGIPDYDGDIKTKHLRDPRNKYNTRIHKGLPPTPIASPQRASLEAILNPTQEGYYYYVRDIDTTDRHLFSKTLAEHNAHVRKLVERTRTKKSNQKREKS